MSYLHKVVGGWTTEATLYTVHGVTWALTLAFTLYAGWLDLRTRRIPNWLTISGLIAGVALNLILDGWHGVVRSLEGAGLALGLLLPLVLLRGLGAGDWKLMGAVGALMGWRPMFFILLAGFLVSGAMGVVQMIMARRTKQTLRNMRRLIFGLATLGLRTKFNDISLDNPTLVKVPFGAAVGAAAVLTFALAHWR